MGVDAARRVFCARQVENEEKEKEGKRFSSFLWS